MTRGHIPQTGSNSNRKIARYFDIQPSVNSELDATLEFFSDDAELNSLDENLLDLWRSDNGGGSYAKAGGTVTPSVNVAVLSGLDSFSRVTAASSGAPLPVELSAFEAQRARNGVVLTWTTLSETNSTTFEVQRAETSSADSSVIQWATVRRVNAAGTTEQAQTYRFTDADLPYTAETLRYRLKQIDLDGTAAYESEVGITLDTPQPLVRHGNYPNPFRDQTTIRYELPKAAKVQLAVYDVLGRRVKMLTSGNRLAARRFASTRQTCRAVHNGARFHRWHQIPTVVGVQRRRAPTPIAQAFLSGLHSYDHDAQIAMTPRYNTARDRNPTYSLHNSPRLCFT